MPGPLPKYTIIMTGDQEKELEHMSQSYTLRHWKVQRAQILVLAHKQPGWSNSRIAREVNASCSTVRHWRRRWASDRTITDRNYSPLSVTSKRISHLSFQRRLESSHFTNSSYRYIYVIHICNHWIPAFAGMTI